MTTFTKFGVVLLASVMLSGCWDKEETHSVSWYSEHKGERTEKLTACDNNPGELGDTPNCKNAKAAELKNTSGTLHNVNNW